MHASPTRGGRSLFAFLALTLLGVGLACGGSGKPAAVAAPSEVSYQNPALQGVVSEAFATLAPSVTGTVGAWSIAPALPAGLCLDTATGTITGTPTAPSAQTTYTVTATNSGGSATTTVQLLMLPAPNVYVGGWQASTSGAQQLTLWTNGTATPLSDGTYNVNGGGIAVSGTGVSIVANGLDLSQASPYLGQLWQVGAANPTQSTLASSANLVQLNGIAVSGTTTYVVGTLGSVATLWTLGGTPNPVVTSLSTSQAGSSANAVFLSGTDVYVAGLVDNLPTYWKNGQATTLALPASATSGSATGIAVAGTEVYVVGAVTGSAGSNSIATVWLDGTPTTLTDGTQMAYGNGIATDGTNIWVAGVNGMAPMVWGGQDGPSLATSPTVLPGSGSANAVTLYGPDVYVAGTIFDADATTSVFTLWRNGQPTTWGDAATQSAGTFLAVSGS